MKRTARFAVLVLAIIALGWVLSSQRSPPPGSLSAIYLGHTNSVPGPGSAVLQITNRTSKDYSFGVQTEALGVQGWGPIAYNQTGPGPSLGSSGYSGWLAGHTGAVIQVLAPETGERFRLTYSRVPTKPENYVSWTLTSVGLPYLFGPRDRTVFVYPVAN